MIAFTDHSVSLGVTGGLSVEDHKKQAAEIKKIQKQLGDEILVLHASEVEIKANGSLDYPDEFLASLDLVLAPIHTSTGPLPSPIIAAFARPAGAPGNRLP